MKPKILQNASDGKYWLRSMYNYFGVELHEGKVYQLTPDKFQRDGLLDDEGWNTDSIFLSLDPIKEK